MPCEMCTIVRTMVTESGRVGATPLKTPGWSPPSTSCAINQSLTALGQVIKQLGEAVAKRNAAPAGRGPATEAKAKAKAKAGAQLRWLYVSHRIRDAQRCA